VGFSQVLELFVEINKKMHLSVNALMVHWGVIMVGRRIITYSVVCTDFIYNKALRIHRSIIHHFSDSPNPIKPLYGFRKKLSILAA